MQVSLSVTPMKTWSIRILAPRRSTILVLSRVRMAVFRPASRTSATPMPSRVLNFFSSSPFSV